MEAVVNTPAWLQWTILFGVVAFGCCLVAYGMRKPKPV